MLRTKWFCLTWAQRHERREKHVNETNKTSKVQIIAIKLHICCSSHKKKTISKKSSKIMEKD